MMDIAIIGYSGRFPEADGIDQFYHNLLTGRDSVRSVSKGRLTTAMVGEGAYKPYAFLNHIDLFDYDFFNIIYGEAENIDPHQRLLLETAYEAFERAAVSFETLKGTKASVYLGDVDQRYYELVADKYNPTLLLGNLNAAPAGRLARFFNLTGAATMVDTACSSSLVALHMACNDLMLGQSSMALVGGASIIIQPLEANQLDETGIDSPDGRAKAFSAAANGTGNGEAVVCVVLKPLKAAIEDGNPIHAVIKATAVNQDSSRSSNLSSPSAIAQTEVILDCWNKAGIDPEKITYIETHGTGTPLGDPIEVEGIQNAFAKYTNKKQFCAISALKSNIGHTDTVAGLAGLIKVVLSLKHKVLFPSLHFETPNPFIDFFDSPLYVNTIAREWQATRRIAGLSAFGLTGTNCHVVVEEWTHPPQTMPPAHSSHQLFTISAKSKESLTSNIALLGKFLGKTALPSMAAISKTLCAGRNHFNYRYAFVANDTEEALGKINSFRENTSIVRKLDDLWIFIPDHSSIDLKWTEDFWSNQEPIRSFNAQTDNPLLAQHPVLLFQMKLLLFLRKLGICSRKLIADGSGKFLIKLIDKNADASVDMLPPPFEEAELHRRIQKFAEEKLSAASCLLVLGREMSIEKLLRQLSEEKGFGLIHMQNQGLLKLVEDLYLQSLPINFDHLFNDPHLQYVDLPPYQFQSTPCWPEDPRVEPAIKDWLYELTWIQRPLTPEAGTRRKQTYLVLTNHTLQQNNICKKLGDKGLHIIDVVMKNKGDGMSTNPFEIRAGIEEDVARLDAVLFEKGIEVNGVIDLMNLGSHDPMGLDRIDETVNQHIVSRLVFYKMMHLSNRNDFKVLFTSCGGAAVFQTDRVAVMTQTTCAFYKALLSDFVEGKVMSIDVDPEALQQPNLMAQWIGDELNANEYHSFCSYRGNLRYIEQLGPLTERTMIQSPLTKGATVLITGGADGVGAEVAKHIAQQCQGTLIILGRTHLPGKGLWAEAIARQDINPDHKRRLENLVAMEKLGGRVTYISADVGDTAVVSDVLAGLCDKKRKPNAIIHAAGIVGRRVELDHIEVVDLLTTLKPKVQGTMNLGQFAAKHQIPIVFFSSLNTVIPQTHSIDYTVANAFEDAFAGYLRAQGIPAISINWGAWGEVGTSAEMPWDDSSLTGPLRPWRIADGLRALDHVLQVDRTNVIVAKFDRKSFTDYPFFTVAEDENHLRTDPLSTAEMPDQSPSTLHGISQTLLKIWKEVLKKENITPDDDFFAIGGHSLLGARIIQLISKRIDIAVEFKEIYRYPTIADMSERIFELQSQSGGSYVPIAPVSKREFYEAAPSQRRLWTVHAIEKNKYGYNLQKTLLWTGDIDRRIFISALMEVFNRHEILRTNFVFKDGQILQYIHEVGEFKYPIEEMAMPQIQQVTKLLQSELKHEFDLASEPLWKVKIVDVSANQMIVNFLFHHLVSDAWSGDIFLNDLLASYRGLTQEGKSRLQPLHIQYKDYAAWINSQSTGALAGEQKEFWINKMRGRTMPTTLCDTPPTRSASFVGGRKFLDLTTVLGGNFLSICAEWKTTSFSAIAASIYWLIAFYTRQKDMVLGMPVSGRNHPDLTDQIGFYVNIVPLRLEIADGENFRDFVTRTNAAVLEAYQYQEYPFDALVNDLRIDRSKHNFPLFDITLTQNIEITDGTIDWDDVRVEEFDVTEQLVSYPLNFDISSSGNGLVVEFGKDFFYEEKIDLLTERFLWLIDYVVRNPENNWSEACARLQTQFMPSEKVDLKFS